MGGSVARRSVSGDMEMESSGPNAASRSLESANRNVCWTLKSEIVVLGPWDLDCITTAPSPPMGEEDGRDA